MDSSDKGNLLNLLRAFGLGVLCGEPTRLDTCIDNICSNIYENIEFSLNHNGISDHSALILNYNSNGQTCNNVTYTRQFTHSNYERFRSLFKSETWSDVYLANSTNDSFKSLINIIQHNVDVAFPLVPSRRSSKKPWITTGIYKSSRTLKLLYKTYVSTGKAEDFEFYKTYKKIYQGIIQTAKCLYNNNRYIKAKNKSSAVWQIINENVRSTRSNNTGITSIKVEDNLITNSIDIANYFNQYFVNITDEYVKQVANAERYKNDVPRSANSMYLELVSEYEVYNVITQLKSSNSMGVDMISPNILKNIIDYVTQPLTCVINRSLNDGVFPETLKKARVVPVYKSNDVNEVKNYRPISLLSALSKILEKIVSQKIISFFEYSRFFNTCQHGFLKNKSTKTAVLYFMDLLYQHMNQGKRCIGVFMDLSKAFDMVDHDILLSKLDCYGIRGAAYNWLATYLGDRTQIVDIGGKYSDELQLRRGVPQGSILGPLLFVVFINDLPAASSLYNEIILYADDSTYICADFDKQRLLQKVQSGLNQLAEWFKNNRLFLNTKKTSFILFTPGFKQYDESYLLKMGGNSIQQVQNVKFLGLHVENSVKWESHVGHLEPRLSPTCYAIYRLRDIASRSVVLSYYYSHFESRIRYGLIFWGLSRHAARIFILQKMAVRNIVGVGRRTSCKPIFKSLGILTLASLYILEILSYMKEQERDMDTHRLTHEYDTRYKNKLCIPQHKLTTYEKSVKYVGIKLYNALDDDIKSGKSIHGFRNKLKKLLADGAYYTVDEFLYAQ